MFRNSVKHSLKLLTRTARMPGLLGACILALSLGSSANAARLFTIDGGSANALAYVIVDDAAVPGQIEITVQVAFGPGNNIGDLTGLFFNLDPYPPNIAITPASFSGPDITGIAISALGNTIDEAGANCNNVNGNGNPLFDVGIMFGACGVQGGNYLFTTTFTMNATYGTTTYTEDSFVNFAIRMQGVGPWPDGGEGSAKLFGDEFCVIGEECQPPSEIPEPATLVLSGLGLLGLGVLYRRRKK